MDPDPDPLVRGADPNPHQSVTGPQHCLSGTVPVIEANSDRGAAVDVGAEWRGKLTAPTASCIGHNR